MFHTTKAYLTTQNVFNLFLNFIHNQQFKITEICFFIFKNKKLYFAFWLLNVFFCFCFRE